MVDMPTIQGAVMSMKAAGDIAKALFQLQTSAEIKGQVIDLQNAILSAQQSAFAAQSEQSSMIEQIRDLKEEIARMKAWEKEKQRYKLINPPWGGGSVVYALKESCKGTEAPHWICTKCYDDGRRTILQPKKDHKKDLPAYVVLVCSTCKGELNTGMRGIGAPEYAPD